MGDKTTGLTGKYLVERVDGKPVNWCFVLQDTDPLTPVALSAYEGAARAAGYGKLADDLFGKGQALRNDAETYDATPGLKGAAQAFYEEFCWMRSDTQTESEMYGLLRDLRDAFEEGSDRLKTKLQAALIAFRDAEPAPADL